MTAHGTTAITINVANEKVDTTTTAKDATTTIANIFAKDATSLKLVAPEGNVDVGTVTGNALNNSLTTFDASGAVSYTHLDVYKRQVPMFTRTRS